MKSLTIEEAGKARVKLENDIRNLLLDFSKNTGLIPTSVLLSNASRRTLDGSVTISAMGVEVIARV